MSQPAIRHRPLTFEEYLSFEEASSVRHEYVAGEIYALAGASTRHNRIAGNIFARLWNAARGTGCRVYMETVKLRTPEDLVYYPDVMVVCAPPSGSPLLEREPCLLVEVISPGTRATDRREKLAAYKRIPTLKTYLIVEQERKHVERHWRDAEGAWWRADLLDEGRVPLPCPELELSLAEIYEGLADSA